MQSRNLVKLIVLSLLGTISLVLFFLSFPLPLMPAYLSVDFSDVPAIIAGLIFSPLAGVLVVMIKNLLYLAVSGSAEPIGVSANFVAGIMFVVPITYFYHKLKNVKSIISGIVTGTIVMAIGMSVLNYFLILPAYGLFMGWEITEQFKWISVIAGILPFNLIKGIIVGLLFVPVFIKMQQWINQQHQKFA